MKPQRRLRLRREALAPLAHDEMAGVVGATHIATDCGCVTHGDSCDACPIPSLPLNSCACDTFELLGTCGRLSVTCPF